MSDEKNLKTFISNTDTNQWYEDMLTRAKEEKNQREENSKKYLTELTEQTQKKQKKINELFVKLHEKREHETEEQALKELEKLQNETKIEFERQLHQKYPLFSSEENKRKNKLWRNFINNMK